MAGTATAEVSTPIGAIVETVVSVKAPLVVTIVVTDAAWRRSISL
jgi:hypothetical protein